MTTEQRMYELFLDELEADFRELRRECELQEMIVKQKTNETTEECERLRSQLRDALMSLDYKDQSHYKEIHKYEWAIKNLINAIGAEIKRSEILTRLNKPQC